MTLAKQIRPVSLVLGLALAGPTLAHHSFAMYDNDHSITVKGTVTKWQWTNPHAYLEIDAPEADGTVKHYVLEGTSINIMLRGGWRSNMIKEGDKVTAVAAPAKDGKPTGLLLEVTFANGQKKDMSIPAGYTFKRTP
jgi:hypothetical protein